MNSQSFLGYFSLFLLSLSFTTAFDITKMLNSHSDFSTYNSFLTQSQVAATINERQTITVLVVDNSGISSLSGKSNEVIKKVMSLHVVLDYYDEAKLQKLPNKTALLTTLFQTTGLANGQQGYLNVTDTGSGDVKFGSAVEGSSLSSSLVKSIASQAYNISVLQITSLIMPAGIENSNTPPAPKAAAPAPSKLKKPPSAADSPSKSPSKSPPPKSSDDNAPTSSKKASPPTAADSPPSPTPAAADASAATDAPAAADAPGGASAKKSSGSRVMTFGVVIAVFIVVVSCFWVAR